MSFPSRTILLTGATGFLGTNLVHTLRERHPDWRLVSYALPSPPPPDGIESILYSPVPDHTLLDSYGFDTIVHLLALSHNRYCTNFDETVEVNVDFTRRMLAYAATVPHFKKFVNLSSIVLYADTTIPPVAENAPLTLYTNAYGFTKGISEMYTEWYRLQMGIPTVTLRLSNTYWPGQAFDNSPFLIPSKIHQGLTEKKITVMNGTPVRDFVYVSDTVDAIIRSIESDTTGIYNVGTGHGYSVREIMEIIGRKLGVEVSFGNEPTVWPIDFCVDASRIRDTMGWIPSVSLDEGIDRTIADIHAKLS